MPIHLRAEPGDYAEACLLPGRPAAREVHRRDVLRGRRGRSTASAGLLGYTGTWEGKPISVQGTGMGCPGATIVFEELIQLGVKKLLRVGTCGGLQARPRARRHDRGDLRRACRFDGDAPGRERAALPDRELGARPRRRPRREGDRAAAARRADRLERPLLQPRQGQYARWSQRGVLAVEMEAAALFTLGALRGVQAGCLLTVSDIVVEGEFTRISDDELRAAVDRMTRIALPRRRRHGALSAKTVFLVNPASANGSTGRRWPEIARRGRASRPGPATRYFGARQGTWPSSRARRRARRRRSCSSSSAATARSTRSSTGSLGLDRAATSSSP